VSSRPNPCILGYNFYLNGILAGFTPDTFYAIPPAYVPFGTLNHACVLAIYGSGYSTTSCYDFTSKFLCPPNTLTGDRDRMYAYLTWKKPIAVAAPSNNTNMIAVTLAMVIRLVIPKWVIITLLLLTQPG